MTPRKTTLIKSTVLPMIAAAGVAVGSGLVLPTSANAATGCNYGSQTAELPAAKARDGGIILAAGCGAAKPCAAGACAPKNPCAAKACAPCNPCAAKNPCSPCNPCAAKK